MYEDRASVFSLTIGAIDACQIALDVLARALCAHGHLWTDAELGLCDKAREVLVRLRVTLDPPSQGPTV